MNVPESFTSIALRGDLLVYGIITLVFGLITAAFFALAVVSNRRRRRDIEDNGFFFAGIFPAIVAGFIGIVLLISLIPYNAKYHHLYQTSGTVTNATNVIQESSGDLTQGTVLEIDTLDRPIFLKDPRAVRLLGSEATFTCGIEFVYAGADRYNCAIAEEVVR